MEYRWLEEVDDFKNIAEEWDKAVIAAENSNPFLLSEFIVTWWRHFGEGRKLAVFAVFDRGRIAAGLPLYIRRGGAKEGFADILSYIGGTVANYTEPLVSPGIALLPALEKGLAGRNDWDLLILSDLRPENSFLSECNGPADDRRYSVKVEQGNFNWAIDLSKGKEAFLSTISKKLRRDLRSKRRLVEKELGKVELKEIKGEADFKRYFDIYTSFSVKAFEARQRKSTFEDERYSSFFKDFLYCMAKDQRLDTHALFAGDKILAISFAYRFGKGFNWALTGFNYDYKYFWAG